MDSQEQSSWFQYKKKLFQENVTPLSLLEHDNHNVLWHLLINQQEQISKFSYMCITENWNDN